MIKKLLKTRTQEQLAKNLNVSQALISQLVAGKKEITSNLIAKIAKSEGLSYEQVEKEVKNEK